MTTCLSCGAKNAKANSENTIKLECYYNSQGTLVCPGTGKQDLKQPLSKYTDYPYGGLNQGYYYFPLEDEDMKKVKENQQNHRKCMSDCAEQCNKLYNNSYEGGYSDNGIPEYKLAGNVEKASQQPYDPFGTVSKSFS